VRGGNKRDIVVGKGVVLTTRDGTQLFTGLRLSRDRTVHLPTHHLVSVSVRGFTPSAFWKSGDKKKLEECFRFRCVLAVFWLRYVNG
jgi:hypothetical protein